MINVIKYLIFIGSISTNRADIFTSSFKLCQLLILELYNLQDYESKFNKDAKYSQITSLLENIRKEVPKSIFDKDNYDFEDCLDENSFISRFVTNPINSYMLVLRFSKSWPELYNLITYLFPNSVDTESHIYITQTELQGVRDAIYRLSVFYNLQPEYLINGSLSFKYLNISNQWTIVPKYLNSVEIFEIGRTAYSIYDYTATKSWMKEALKQIYIEKNQNNSLLFNILDYLSWSEYELGDIEEAIIHCEEMIKINSQNKRVMNNLKLFKEFKQNNTDNSNNKINDYDIDLFKDKQKMSKMQKEYDNYSYDEIDYKVELSISKLLCNHGNLWDQPKEKLKENYCYIKKGTHKFGKFVTTNVEKIFSEPDVWFFRNVVNEGDIKYFKKLSIDHLKTATVNNPVTGRVETAFYRIQQSSWFNIESDPVIKKLISKFRVATGLTFEITDSLQIANYGIGGYYSTHFDFGKRNDPSNKNKYTRLNGKRIATILLYMSDVPIGGNTGFTRLGTSIKPSKGDAIFWYNLLPDGSGDARTRHIACPVVLGSKWVGNLWIRSKGEELSKPCSLTEQNGL